MAGAKKWFLRLVYFPLSAQKFACYAFVVNIVLLSAFPAVDKVCFYCESILPLCDIPLSKLAFQFLIRLLDLSTWKASYKLEFVF